MVQKRLFLSLSLCCFSNMLRLCTKMPLYNTYLCTTDSTEKGRKENTLLSYGSLFNATTHTHIGHLCKKKSISMLNLGICESVYVENWQRSVESFVVLSQNNISRDLYRCCLSLCSVCILKKSLFFLLLSCVGKLNLYLMCKNSFMCISKKAHTHIQ